MKTKFRLAKRWPDIPNIWAVEYKKWYQLKWHRIPFNTHDLGDAKYLVDLLKKSGL